MALTFLSSTFPPASKFKIEQIPNLSEEVAIVTGGNSGIGKVTCRVLLSKGARVYMASRSADKASAAIEDIKRATGKEGIHFLKLDLSDLTSVKRAADEFTSKESRLHMLFNNAAVMACPIEETTKQGYDMQFGTNVLAPAYLTKLLLPTLLTTAESTPDAHVRVINTASSAQYNAPKGGIMYDTLVDGPARRKKGTPWSLYMQSKWASVVYGRALAARYGERGVVSTALDPGNIKTDLWRYQSPGLMRFVNTVLLHDVEHGALTQLYAGTMPAAAKLNGAYLHPWARVGKPRCDALHPKVADRLWEWLEGEIGKFEGGGGA